MNRTPYILVTFLVFSFSIVAPQSAIDAAEKPNIILILTDDLGYGDLSCYGSEFIKTPRIDKMASMGVRAKEYRVAANICTPSRAALLTGSYPQRAGIPNGISPKRPEHRHLGLHPNEFTIAELLKTQAYATAMIGKWHLGFDDVFHPLNYGFDSYYGLPTNYSHDKRFFDDKQVIEEDTDLSMLTSRYTDKAVEFITNNSAKPFFLYLAHNYPHVPLKPNPAFAGKSKAGDYGDIIEELDASTGSILDTLNELEIAENTLIIFTSDNGPLPRYADEFGSAGSFRGSKYVTFEGGHRVPAIFYWPDRLPSEQVCEVPISSMDVLPTIAGILGARLPDDRILDGRNIWPILTGDSKTPPREIDYYYNDNNLQAIRRQDWKIHLPRTMDDLPFWHRNGNKEFQELAEPYLVNLNNDIGESENIASKNTSVVNELLSEAQTTRQELGSSKSRGTAQRPIGDSRELAIASRTASKPPNIILIFTDDQGYQDIGVYGSPNIKTPHLDRMTEEGMRFTDFYAQTVCGPSRAALMTGSYPLRIATKGNRVDVHPYMHTKEITIAEVLKPLGYKTAAFGKWDLAGHTQDPKRYAPELMPTHQGFDYYFGTSSSNDSKAHLIRNETVIEMEADMSQLTRRYTDEAIGFIKRSKDSPFFIYMPHTMPHIRLERSAQFEGKSKGGIYGDVIEEIDWNVGRIFETLKEEGLDDSTYVFYMSDNGPWYLGSSKGHLDRIGPDAEAHGGSALPLRGAKTATWEGGLRVPCIMWAPGQIPAGTVCSEIASTMDMLPTIAKLAGGEAPTDRVIDGHDISDLLHGIQGTRSPTQAFYYYARTQLRAVRSGPWKLHLPLKSDQFWARYSKPEDVIDFSKPLLYNLESDLSETIDVSNQHPAVVKKLLQLVEDARNDIGDIDKIGANARFFDDDPKRPDIVAGN
ncbi:sulfatase [Opitutia bacterium ISCC 51]|nr:sulfatase [Opitutae bacterium ISCC 51]QXD27166.1 sulfatase [Opitutae bacterium ISCC 52]